MYILGINAAFHDTAAALVKNGKIIAAAEEERFTHIKHGKRPIPFSTWELPFHAIDYCLKTAGITLQDVDRIAYSFDPEGITESVYQSAFDDSADVLNAPDVYKDWDTLFLNYVRKAPEQLRDGYPHHLQKRLANGGMLHHVTMSYDIDADKMVDVLRIGKEKLSDKGTTSAKKRVDPLRRQTGLARAEIVEAMMEVFAERYGATPSEITARELETAKERVASKFGTEAWLHRVP